MSGTDDARRWEQGWDGHRVDQLRRLARLPLAEKLQWLEEAARVVRHLSVSASRRRIGVASNASV